MSKVEAARLNVPYLRPAERATRGKAARTEVSRTLQAEIEVPKDRDAVALLEEQASTRLPGLMPTRYGRMLASAFAFYRRSALIMATDLSRTPNSGIRTQLCGDAHMSNFGAFGSPERTFVFDVNDFDETTPGPWEWDVKRLAASVEIAGRENDFSHKAREEAVRATIRSYREAMSSFAAMQNLQVWNARLPMEQVLQEFSAGVNAKQLKLAEEDVARSRTRDSMHAYEKLTHIVDGEPRIINDPPLIVPFAELLPPGKSHTQIETEIRDLFVGYRHSLASDRRVLLDQFRYADQARKVVGVGSVGTRDGSPSSSASTIRIPFSFRSRRLNPRCSSGSSARASSPTTASVSSQGSD